MFLIINKPLTTFKVILFKKNILKILNKLEGFCRVIDYAYLDYQTFIFLMLNTFHKTRFALQKLPNRSSVTWTKRKMEALRTILALHSRQEGRRRLGNPHPPCFIFLSPICYFWASSAIKNEDRLGVVCVPSFLPCACRVLGQQHCCRLTPPPL